MSDTSSPSSSTTNSRPDNNASNNVLSRRRDKRRHLSTETHLDLRDPLSVIALAVRYDEAWGDEALLTIPLEQGGSLYHNQKAFTKALLTLQKKTALPPPASQHQSRSQSGRAAGSPASGMSGGKKRTTDSSDSVPPVPITPIILSGLLASISSSTTTTTTNEENSLPTSSELVSYCQAMRRAAVARLRDRKDRQRIQRTLIPIVFVVGPILLYLWTMYNVRQIILEFGFVDDHSCGLQRGHDDDVSTSDISDNLEHGSSMDSDWICRHVESKLWERLQPSSTSLESCTLESCPKSSQTTDHPEVFASPYAMHTTLIEGFVDLDEVESGYRNAKSSRKRRSDPTSANHMWSPLQWLGDTQVNRLIREVLFTSSSGKPPSAKELSSMRLLDVGCGIGGSLYSLLSSEVPLDKQLTYHGVAITRSEVYQAQELQRRHDLATPQIFFDTHDFSQPFADSYSAMIAVESLSHSQHLDKTLQNLERSLLSKGTLVVIEDVVLFPKAGNSSEINTLRSVSARPSLITYQEWMERFSAAGFVVQSVTDLSLEMDTPDLNDAPLMIPSPWRVVAEWRQRTAQLLFDRWSSWVVGGENHHTPLKHGDKASLRAMRLVQDLVRKTQGDELRQAAFHNAALGYYMFVCTKI